MQHREDILSELKALSTTVAAIPRVNVYTVPDGYFNLFSDSVLAQLSPDTLPSFQPGMQASMSVPEGYFEGLADSILQKIRREGQESVWEETRRLAPSLAAIGNANVYAVPEAYFESLEFLISQRVAPPAPVVQMRRRPAMFRQMMAAVVTGIIGISLFSLFNNKTTSTETLVPANNEAVMAKAGEILRNNSFEKELASISDQDIESYLTNNGQDVHAALVASATDDVNALPASEEYLTNENTLDEFLDKMNLNN